MVCGSFTAANITGPGLAASPQLFNADNSHTVLWTVSAVFFGCFLAFMLSVAEFLLLSHTSSLTLSISGIFKEICTLSLATEFAGDKMTVVNFFGLVLCLMGIGVHVVTKATRDADTSTFSNLKLKESKQELNGGVDLVELLPLSSSISDDNDDDEYQ